MRSHGTQRSRSALTSPSNSSDTASPCSHLLSLSFTHLSSLCSRLFPSVGKSTLLKLLTHKLTPTDGTVVHHPAFTLAYFGQHSTAELNLEQTPIEFMQTQFPEESAGTLRQHLAKTSVVGTTADTRMHRLSFSQRSCVIFSKLTFVCPHLLIMDEPTNFLDLESVDALIAACNKYKGALLLVSHNRDFLKKCAKQYLSVVPGSFKMYDNLKVNPHAHIYTHLHTRTQCICSTASFSTSCGTPPALLAVKGPPPRLNGRGSRPLGRSTPFPTPVWAPLTLAPPSHRCLLTCPSPYPPVCCARLKDAESGTYSFIAEMEEGGKVGADALVNTPGGGSIHSRQKTGAAASTSTSTTTIENGVKSITIGGGPIQMTTAPKALTYAKDEKVQALWTDGKFYAAQIVKIDAPGKYSVKYLEYGNVQAGMNAKDLKKEVAAPAGAAGGKPAAGKAAAGKPAAGKAAKAK